MTAEATSRPGVQVGPTSEFSLFFHVRPGHGPALRETLRALQESPGYRPGDYDLPIETIHEARFVPFDDDTRLLFATSFDGSWDAYMVDFASKPLRLFDAIFQHVVGYAGLPNLEAVRNFIMSAQVTAGGYSRNYGGTVLFTLCVSSASRSSPRSTGSPTAAARRSRRAPTSSSPQRTPPSASRRR